MKNQFSKIDFTLLGVKIIYYVSGHPMLPKFYNFLNFQIGDFFVNI